MTTRELEEEAEGDVEREEERERGEIEMQLLRGGLSVVPSAQHHRDR